MTRTRPRNNFSRLTTWAGMSLLVLALDAMADVESTQTLGHGFRLVVISEPVQGGFESVGHFRYCYYESLNLGRCDELFPSPDGEYAVYQLADTGLVMFFDARSGQRDSVTSTFPGLLGTASWEEAHHIVHFTANSAAGAHTMDFDYGKWLRN